jgi:hypothetical protein
MYKYLSNNVSAIKKQFQFKELGEVDGNVWFAKQKSLGIQCI